MTYSDVIGTLLVEISDAQGRLQIKLQESRKHTKMIVKQAF